MLVEAQSAFLTGIQQPLFHEATALPAVSLLRESLDACAHQFSCLGGGVGPCSFQGHHEYLNGNMRKIFIWSLDGAQAMGNSLWFMDQLAPQFVLDINRIFVTS